MFKVPGVFGVWWGGSGYSASKASEHLEAFGSLEGAKEALRERASGSGSYPREFRYLLAPERCVAVPAVGNDSWIDLYDVWVDAGGIRYEESGSHVEFGPAGGVKIVRG